MNSGFLKSFALAILLTAVLIIAVNVIGDFAVRPKPGYSPHKMAGKQTEAPVQSNLRKPKGEPAKAVEAAAGSPAETLAALLANADPEQGKKIFRKCRACHSVADGGPNRVGPNLWNVVGRAKGSHQGYKYSDTMRTIGGKWTYKDLNTFLTNPRAFAKGTKMTFKGLAKPASRAGVIAYLRTLSDNPKPLP